MKNGAWKKENSMKKIPVWLLAAALLLLLTACNDRKKSDAPTAGGMKSYNFV